MKLRINPREKRTFHQNKVFIYLITVIIRNMGGVNENFRSVRRGENDKYGKVQAVLDKHSRAQKVGVMGRK